MSRLISSNSQPAAAADSAEVVTPGAPMTPAEQARRMEELGRIILAYSEVTEKLQQSHEQLKDTVERLQNELSWERSVCELLRAYERVAAAALSTWRVSASRPSACGGDVAYRECSSV